MKNLTPNFLFMFLLSLLLIGLTNSQSFQNVESSNPREKLLMNFNWRFAFGHAYDAKKDFNNGTSYFSYYTKAGYGDGPAARNFDDRTWRILDLPHDWAVELPFDSTASYSHGYKTVGRNFPKTSIGWYRKTFTIPESDLGRRISIIFDGVHRNSVVWVNGFYLGEEHCGYYNFEYDITDCLNYGSENVVAVRADATMEEGWYYEGAGIYRHVWLSKTAPLHIVTDGTFVSSEVKDNAADITAQVTIINENKNQANFNVEQKVINASGKMVTEKDLKNLKLDSKEENEFSTVMSLQNPNLWSPESPYLYKLITTINSNGKIVDRYETTFGIRTIRFDANDGFFLNGKHYLLKGTNNHQDHAGVGTAIPDALQEFRIKKLKEMGSNAYRCSHNPPTPELLDACDKLGMLVIDENRLLGTNIEHLNLLKRMILRDRNHPSVFVWSIGNEEWAVEGNITGARIAATMQDYVQHLDPTRRVTYASSGWGNGISTVQDIMGFNYIFNGDIDKQHTAFPNQPGMGTEETTSRSTRGIYEDDVPNAHMMATDRKPNGRSIEEGFKFYAARSFLTGLFYWTGFDYRGEPHPYGWPQVASQSGIVDLCGFPKDMFYYLKSRWTDKPVLHIFPHWNPVNGTSWKEKEGKPINVWAYTNCDEVELFLNGKSMGRKTMPENSHIEWLVNYEPGVLLAKGYKNGNEIIAGRVETTGDPTKIKLVPDRSIINADGEDISVITIQIEDSDGRIVPTAGNEIKFSLSGPGKIIGVGNGDPSSHEPDRYIDNVSQVSINNLKAKLVETIENIQVTGIEFDDSNWQSLLNEQSNYNVKADDNLKNVVIRGTFNLPELTGDSKISLFPKSLGEEQAVSINGHQVAKNIKRDDPVLEYKLDNSILLKGENVYAIVGTPLIPRFQYDNLNTDPGIIKVFKPAETWKRKAFNGLAQVIVQSTKEAGEIILLAESDVLTSGTVKLQTQQIPLRPAVSDK
jgi:beta-galactosidase